MILRAEAVGQRAAGRWLFRGLDLEVKPATITAVVGPNASGKSTLLRRLAGLELCEEGRVMLGDRPLRSLRARARAREIAYLPQSMSLYHDLSVRELVELGRAPHRGRFSGPAPSDRSAVELALERVGAADLGARRLLALSGGERQRVMLARMLATGAPILVLDEPTAALDVAHALDFLALCRALAGSGAALLLALHDLDAAREHADLAVALGRPGGETRTGPPARVLDPAALAELFEVEVAEVTRLWFSRRVQ